MERVVSRTRVKIPGYRILEVRGVGAMATVYRAEQVSLERRVGLKVLHDFVAEDADYRERFLREARAAARLNHPHVVRAYEAGVHEGSYYFAMEYVEGEDLSERLGREERLEPAEALRIAIAVAQALLAAQEHGMVHRDVKPENILLGPDGAVKLADLGLAKVQGDASITQSGYSLGTVAFFSPEQCHGATDLDIRSDLFALGGVLYASLTGELPFGRGDNPPATMKTIIEDHPPGLEGGGADQGELAAYLPGPLREALLVLMAKDRRERPADARAAIALLERARTRLERGEDGLASSGEGEGGGPRTRRRRRQRRGFGSASAAGARALASGGAGVPLLILAGLIVLGLGVLVGALPALGFGRRLPAANQPAALPAGQPRQPAEGGGR